MKKILKLLKKGFYISFNLIKRGIGFLWMWAYRYNYHTHCTEKWCKKIGKYADRYKIEITGNNFDAIKAELASGPNLFCYLLKLIAKAVGLIGSTAFSILTAYALFTVGGEKTVYTVVTAILTDKNQSLSDWASIIIFFAIFLIISVVLFENFKNLVNTILEGKRKKDALSNLKFDMYKAIRDNGFAYPKTLPKRECKWWKRVKEVLKKAKITIITWLKNFFECDNM